MNRITNYENVHLDSQSDDTLDTIVEKEYLKELFVNLEKKLGSRFSEFEFHVLFSHDPSVVPYSHNSPSLNKILFWFSDESGLYPDHLVNNYQVIFKSYIQKEGLNVYSNPLGYVNEFRNQRDKKKDKKDIIVFFSGSLNINRKNLYKLLFFRKLRFLKFLKLLPNKALFKLFNLLKLNNLSDKNNTFIFSHGFKTGLEYERYFDYLLRSKFILCPKGNQSSETFRHIEALHAGSIIISQPMPDVSIYKNNPFITYNNYIELTLILEKIEKNNFDLLSLSKNHKMFYENNFTIEAITNRVSKILQEYLQ